MKPYSFDYDKACFILDSYGSSTGLTCSLVDETGRIITSVGDHGIIYDRLKMNRDRLSESFLYGATQASVFGGSYIYFGPFGLVYFTTPILAESVIAGAFVVGPVLMTEPDQFLCDKLFENARIKASSNEDVLQLIKTIPVIPARKVKSLSDLLLVASHYVDDQSHQKFREDQKRMAQGSEIASYMAYLKTMGGETLGESAYPIEKERELMNLISIGDEDGARRVLNEIMAHIYIGYGMNYKLLKSRVLELVVLLSRAALEGGAQAEEVFGLNYSYLSEIHDYDSVDQLTEWLGRIIKRFTMSVFRFGEAKHQDAIYKALEYIKHNYMNKLTLEEVAEHVFFSGAYFSKIFKNETGTTFNKYLNKVRISASKQLLKEKDLALAEIADTVGFHDQSHFSKMFKTITGTSPKKYRESLK